VAKPAATSATSVAATTTAWSATTWTVPTATARAATTWTISAAATAARASASWTALCAFGRDDELQELLGVIKEFVRLLGIHSQCPRSKLRRHRRPGHSGVCGNETHFIHVDVWITLKCSLQLFS
jgi:hypothetical protein